MNSQVLIVLFIVLFLVILIEGMGILALFRQIGLLHVAVTGGNSGHNPTVRTLDPLPTGARAPYLGGISVQNTPVSLEKLVGQRVLVAFVHPLCKPCNEIASELEALHRDPVLDTRVIVVSDSDRISTEEYVAEHGLTVPVLYEPRSDFNTPGQALGSFRVPRTPFAYLLDEQHRVVTSGTTGGKEFFWRVAKGSAGTGIPTWHGPSMLGEVERMADKT